MPWRGGSPNPAALTPLPRLSISPLCLSPGVSPCLCSLFQSRASSLPCWLRLWAGPTLLLPAAPIHPAHETNNKPGTTCIRCVCLWGGRVVMCTLDPCPRSLPCASLEEPGRWALPPRGHGLFARSALLPHPILKRPVKGGGLPEFTQGDRALCSPTRSPGAELSASLDHLLFREQFRRCVLCRGNLPQSREAQGGRH